MSQYLNNQSAEAFLQNKQKSITLLGMSGVGKTTLVNTLPWHKWFKFSGDYRIGTRYLGEAILDNLKRQAMQVPFLADLLLSDSIYICNNITFNNLQPLSTFLGKIGNPELGGIELEEFLRRQKLHHDAEIAAMLDVPHFIERSQSIYGYQHFINDAGGSLSELDDENVYATLAKHTLIIYLKAGDDMLQTLIERAHNQPKPLYYQQDFFRHSLQTYLQASGIESTVDIAPNDFIRWIFPRLLEDRLPRYERIAEQYGITINASEVFELNSEHQILDLVANELQKRNG